MKKIIVILSVMFLVVSNIQAQSKLEKNFKELSDEILNNLQSFYPVIATDRGVHDYDYKLTDYSRKSVKNEISRLKKFEVRIKKYSRSNLSPESRINLKLLKSNVDIALQDLKEIKWHKINPYLYVDDAVTGVYLILASEYSPLEVRAHNVIGRMKEVPDLFKEAKKNLTNPPPVFIRLADEMLTTGIEFYRTVNADLSAHLPELQHEINQVATVAIEAMRDFKNFLAKITPGEPGSFAIGKENFDYKLSHEYMLDYDSDSLLKIGEKLLEEVTTEYNEYLAKLDSTKSDVDSVFVLDCVTKDDIMRYYNWETEQTKLFLKEHDIVTIPDDIGHCEVIETPSFLTNIISSIAYQPPGVFSPVQKGLFYVRPIPDSMDAKQKEARFKYIQRRGFRGSVVHEAYPGHHLQFQMASRVADDVHKWQNSAMLYEGWALYTEEMMYHHGFYGDDTRRYLNVLGGVWFRAARIVVDVKLHTGQFTREEAVVWFAEQMDADTTGWVKIEIDRYTMTPTIQMSYLMGKLELLKLRDTMKVEQGDSFSLKAFHDKFISEGSVPPAMLWEIWDLKE